MFEDSFKKNENEAKSRHKLQSQYLILATLFPLDLKVLFLHEALIFHLSNIPNFGFVVLVFASTRAPELSH